MYYFVDESGNTGLNLFDEAQPWLYYGVLGCRKNLDVIAEPLLKRLRAKLGVERIHANQLGIGRLLSISEPLVKFSKQHDVRLSMFKVSKPDHAIISFFDQVFDSGVNDAVSWEHYWTPLRYALLFKVAHLFDDQLSQLAWAARREQNSARCNDQLTKICEQLIDRLGRLPDARSREIVGGALRWAKANPSEILYGVGNRGSELQISPNLIGFQQVLQGIAIQSAKMGRTVKCITVDRQTQFNAAQAELADIYTKMRGHTGDMGPGMPTFNWSSMLETPPVFKPGDASAGLEMIDISLWLIKRLQEGRDVPDKLKRLIYMQSRRGITDQVSLEALDIRWRHLIDLPQPDAPLSEELVQIFANNENRRLAAVASIED